MIVDIHAHLGHHPLMDFKQTPEEILKNMEKYGIDITFLMPFPSMKIQEVNDNIAAVVKEHPDRLIGFGCIDPNADGSLEEGTSEPVHGFGGHGDDAAPPQKPSGFIQMDGIRGVTSDIDHP